MKKESTKLVKKKLELKKSTVAKFIMNDEQMKAIPGGILQVPTTSVKLADGACTAH